MKKVKLYLVSILTILMALFSFVGCGPVGKYTATAYKLGSASISIEDSNSYIELKLDKSATIHIDIAGVMTVEDSGKWEKGEGKEVKITTDSTTYTVTVDGKTLTFGVIVFTK